MREVTAGLSRPFAYGRDFIDRVAGADPVAGAHFSFANDSRFSSRLLSAQCRFVAGAAAANRWLELQYRDQEGTVWHRFGAGVLFVANDVATHVWQVDRGVGEWSASAGDATPYYAPLADVWLEGADQVRIFVGNIAAADQLSAIRLVFERFPSGPRGYPEGVEPAGPAHIR